jgi:general secretion pathway protein K
VAGRGRGRESGVALLAVLGIAALLTLIAFGLTERARTVTSLLANQIAAARAEALADAGVHHALLTLVRGFANAELVVQPPRAYLLELDGGAMRIEIADEDGRIDLNAAPAELLANLFVQLGRGADEANALAQAIVQRRDAARAGAEADTAAGSPVRAFPTLGALQGVAGMDEALYRLARPHLTVFGQGEGLDPRAADPLTAASLPGIDPDLARRITLGDEDALESALQNDTSAALIFDSRLTVYGLRAEARLPGGAAFVREAVVEITGDAGDPFLVLGWQEGEAHAPEAGG